jgi:hypothetical protein
VLISGAQPLLMAAQKGFDAKPNVHILSPAHATVKKKKA